MLPDKTEQHREVASEKYGRSENSDQGKPSRHEAGLVQQQAQQQVAYGRHEALSEEEDAVIEGDKRMTDGERICSRSGLPQGYDRQEECHAGIIAVLTPLPQQDASGAYPVKSKPLRDAVQGEKAERDKWIRAAVDSG